MARVRLGLQIGGAKTYTATLNFV